MSDREKRLQEACELVLMFYTSPPWNELRKIAWDQRVQALCPTADDGPHGDGRYSVTTKVLCDCVRAAMEDGK